MVHWRNGTDRVIRGTRKEPTPFSLSPPQMPRGLTWDRTRASAVRGRRLTARAVARPSEMAIKAQ